MTTNTTKRYVREDGRLLDTLREQTSVLNTITRSTSSCEWHSDETKVVASIQGPRELQFSSLSQSKEDGERLVVECYCKLLPPKNDDEDDGSDGHNTTSTTGRANGQSTRTTTGRTTDI